MRRSFFRPVVVAVAMTILLASESAAQQAGSIRGAVFLESGDPVHGAVVMVPRIGRSGRTDTEGHYEISGVPPGSHQVTAQREHLSSPRQTVTVVAGEATHIDFLLLLSPIHEEITVTATAPGQTTAYEAFNSITTLDSYDLTRRMSPTIGELLEDEPGVARRSFGPGSSRPIIRGFDGDRVLIMQDGVRTGDLSSQSGDHGLTLDPAGFDRVEIVRGPATLLYGSNAIGGVVNAVTPHESFRGAPDGTRFQFNTDGGTANRQAGVSANMQHREGAWSLWFGGASRRTGDYDTPEGEIENSETRLSTGRAGLGWARRNTFFSLGYQIDDGRNGIPFADEFHGHGGDDDGDEDPDHDHDHEDDHDDLFVRLDSRRQALRFDVGLTDLQGLVESFRTSVSYLDWRHDEMEIEGGFEEVGTSFRNESVVLRSEFNQRRQGRLSGRFGVWGQTRDYEAVGHEALAPPTRQNAFAAFAYEQVDVGRLRLLFGGRVETNRFNASERPDDDHDRDHDDHDHESDHDEDHDDDFHLDAPEPRNRLFTGASASFGVHVDLTPDTAFVVNLSRSYRSPSLEELYNFGPHVGNLTFEVGNPDLDPETSVGFDVSLKHRSAHAKGEFNVFAYNIGSFVFPSFIDAEVDGLRVAEFLQGDSRFVGFDAKASVSLHPSLWLNVGAGHVDAKLTASGRALPRIPPFHGTVELEVPYRGFSVTPQLRWAAKQDRISDNETETAGFAVLNLNSSYVWARSHATHMVAASFYNVTDRLYRQHTSFIKDLAPEIGRGVRVTYSVRFF